MEHLLSLVKYYPSEECQIVLRKVTVTAPNIPYINLCRGNYRCTLETV